LTTKTKKVQLYASEDVLTDFYNALVNNDAKAMRKVHIPRSDVFYVREHLRSVFPDKELTLDYVERCMYLEGMLTRHDVLEPGRKRPYESSKEDHS
tara:strand:- start:3 stop:290 length:288 start_codon:yes stop_codon:yes gene_type:complete